jgi:hypothetical protein
MSYLTIKRMKVVTQWSSEETEGSRKKFTENKPEQIPVTRSEQKRSFTGAINSICESYYFRSYALSKAKVYTERWRENHTMAKIWSSSSGTRRWRRARTREEKGPRCACALWVYEHSTGPIHTTKSGFHLSWFTHYTSWVYITSLRYSVHTYIRLKLPAHVMTSAYVCV